MHVRKDHEQLIKKNKNIEKYIEEPNKKANCSELWRYGTNGNWETYHTVINLEPLVLNILNIAHIVTRESSIHNIQVNNYPIQSVYGWFITSPTHKRCQVKYFRKLNRLVEFAKFSGLQNICNKCKVIYVTGCRKYEQEQLVFEFNEWSTWNLFNAIVRTLGASEIVSFFLAFS